MAPKRPITPSRPATVVRRELGRRTQETRARRPAWGLSAPRRTHARRPAGDAQPRVGSALGLKAGAKDGQNSDAMTRCQQTVLVWRRPRSAGDVGMAGARSGRPLAGHGASRRDRCSTGQDVANRLHTGTDGVLNSVCALVHRTHSDLLQSRREARGVRHRTVLTKRLTSTQTRGLDCPPMEGRTADSSRAGCARVCAREGCANTVKKPTAKYCSVQCCASDPERLQRLRVQARRQSTRAVLPLARQLTIGLTQAPQNPEAQIATLCDGREDLPHGMSRLVG